MQGVSVHQGPEIEGRRARLSVHTPAGAGPVDGVVLILHGGRATSTAPTSPTQLAVLRMAPFAGAVAHAARRTDLRVAVAELRHRVRGWNGERRDPVVDATWALDALREQVGDAPVALLGHSMGGRTAFALADAPGVVGVVGLAPWVDGDDAPGEVAGVRIDVLHGTADRMTDPRASRAWTEQARARGALTTYTPVDGAGHTMLRRASWWHGTAAATAVTDLRAVRGAVGSTGQDVTGLYESGQGTNDRRSVTGSRRHS